MIIAHPSKLAGFRASTDDALAETLFVLIGALFL